MKAIKRILKKTTIVAILICGNIYAQDYSEEPRKFVRVFNLQGKKIHKGYIVFVNDSILGFSKNKNIAKVSFEDIGTIKMKRSGGNNALTAGAIGGVIGALVGMASSDEETKVGQNWLFGQYTYTTGTSPGTGAAMGGGIGLVGGALIGLGSSLLKNKEVFTIDGDLNKWLAFKVFIEN